MKVVMLGKWPEGEPIGGVAVHTVNLVRHLGKFKELDLYMISFGNKSQILNEGRIKIILIKAKKIYYVFPILALIRLALEIRKIKPDIIHVQGSNLSPYLLYTLFLSPPKCQRTITVHGLVLIEAGFDKGIGGVISKFIGIPLEKYALSKIPNIIVCSPAMKSLLKDITNSKIHVIPNGIDFDNIQDIPAKIDLNHPNIFFIGLLKEVKGIDLLLKSIPIIKKSITDIYVYIAGSGPLENELKLLVKKLDIEEEVNFLGFVSGDEKYSYLKSANVCVFPSIYEPFGIVIIEAMACGKAVVASNVGGIPFIVEDGKTGLLFEPSNVEELAEKIIELLENRKFRMKIGAAGKEKAKEFKWDKIAITTAQHYQEFISEKKNHK